MVSAAVSSLAPNQLRSVSCTGLYCTQVYCCAVLPHREVLYAAGPDGKPRVTGLRMGNVGREQVIKADAYVAALDIPGAKALIPKVIHESSSSCRACCGSYS